LRLVQRPFATELSKQAGQVCHHPNHVGAFHGLHGTLRTTPPLETNETFRLKELPLTKAQSKEFAEWQENRQCLPDADNSARYSPDDNMVSTPGVTAPDWETT
jgi:hypothetical protein